MRVHLPDVASLRRHRRSLAEGDWAYVLRRKHVRPGNLVQPLRAGREVFPSMLQAIASAQSHVYLETYILRADRTGDEFKEALIERARAGIRVRLLYDSLGSFGLSSAYVAELRGAGVAAVEYHPLVPWRARWSLNRRDHQKILVVDDLVAFVGGTNIGDEYRPEEDGGGGWFDLHARVEGPVVLDLARIFRATWERSGGEELPEPRKGWRGTPGPMHTAEVQAISNAWLGRRWRMHRTYLHAIRRAKHSISVMNAYFIPDRRLRRAFGRAAERGVSVKVIVPSILDVRAVYYASRHLYGSLLQRGVRIFEWPDRMMHAKSGTIDSTWSTIGSYNLDRRSLLHNLEIGLVILDRRIGSEMQRQFDQDLASCREITLEEWGKRSAWEKALEWLFFQIRYWL
jgi:cardiolipin synthase